MTNTAALVRLQLAGPTRYPEVLAWWSNQQEGMDWVDLAIAWGAVELTYDDQGRGLLYVVPR